MKLSELKTPGLVLVLIIAVSLVTTFSVLKGSGGSINKSEVEKIVAEYIENNPQAILDSVSKYQRNKSEQEDKKAQEQIQSKLKDIENDKNSPIAGNPKGDVVIVEFFDYSCGYCKKVLPSVTKIVEEDKNVKVVFKEFPILGPNSELASKAALAVNAIAPGKYFEFHKKLLEARINGQDSINAIAKELGINVKDMEAKMNSPEVMAIIVNDRALASSIGVRGTPAFIVGGTFVPGAIDYDAMKNLVAEARKKK